MVLIVNWICNVCIGCLTQVVVMHVFIQRNVNFVVTDRYAMYAFILHRGLLVR